MLLRVATGLCSQASPKAERQTYPHHPALSPVSQSPFSYPVWLAAGMTGISRLFVAWRQPNGEKDTSTWISDSVGRSPSSPNHPLH